MKQYRNHTLQKILIIIIIILLITIIVSLWLKQPQQTVTPQPLAVKQPAVAVAVAPVNHVVHKQTPVHKTTTSNQQVNFDFYSLLARQQPMQNSQPVVSPGHSGESNPGQSNVKNLTPADKTNTYYLLQVGALQDMASATRFKQQLTAMGYSVSIQPFRHQQQLWYRVLVGPYALKNTAKLAQQKLYHAKIPSILLPMLSK